MNQKTKEYVLALLKTDIEVNPDLGALKDMYYEVDAIEVESNHDTKALHNMKDALEQYRDAYNNLRDAWEKYDINQTESIKEYPYSCSFDEIDVNEWCNQTIKELDEIDYPFIGEYKNDSYFCGNVKIYIHPRQSYTRALLVVDGQYQNMKWWFDMDIVTSDTREALEECKKDKYQSRGYSESY